jgi:hypothetical protein
MATDVRRATRRGVAAQAGLRDSNPPDRLDHLEAPGKAPPVQP